MARFSLECCTLTLTDLDYITHEYAHCDNQWRENLLKSGILVIIIVSSVVFGDKIFNSIKQSNDAFKASALSQEVIRLPER